MNSDITFNLSITGASLDAIIGRALTASERVCLINEAIGHMIGYEDGMTVLVRSIRELVETGHDEDDEGVDKAHEVEEDEFDIPNWIDASDTHDIQPREHRLSNFKPIRAAKKAKEDAKKDLEERRVKDLAKYDATPKSWADYTPKRALEIVREMGFNGHSIRRLKAYEEAGLPIGLVAHHYRKHSECWDWPAGVAQNYDFVPIKDVYGHTYNRPCVPEFWGVADSSVLYDIASAFKLNARSAIGRGTSSRNIVEALEQYVAVMDGNDKVCEDNAHTIAQMAGLVR